ncbi:hypothetical protein AVEN_133311-1 [Araneus ventricosus]|uniref:Uncharacterized protein n=1 Tax=Araneus ventricosus TaxID=182803 RepID=A0A4Y2DJR4_ARAVE|nr:hypothetical protein AVEN_133311-1 [Araneus ventricosus]
MSACVKEDIGASPAEMVYGQCLRLPGKCFRNFTSFRQMLSEDTFLQRLGLCTRKAPSCAYLSPFIVFVHPDLRASSHVFVRCDTVKKPLEHPYQGPFKVIRRNEKFFKISVNKHQSRISIDRLKPAYVLPEVSSESSLSKTAESKCQTVSKQPVTRSGRRVRLVEPYQAY